MSKYLGLFDSRDDVANQFEVGDRRTYKIGEAQPPIPEDFPTDEQMIAAVYEYEDYNGDAFVLFERDGKIFEVHGSHCSCMGLEGQWEPEETTVAALRHRITEGKYGIVNHKAVRELIRAYIDRASPSNIEEHQCCTSPS